MSENKFACDYAKRGTAGCKKCKQKIEKGLFRIAKVVTNPFSDDGDDMKQWHHPSCLFETFQRARATTKIIESLDDIDGFTELKQEDKDLVNKLISELPEKKATPKKKTPAKKVPPASASSSGQVKNTDATTSPSTSKVEPAMTKLPVVYSKDNLFREYRRLCASIAEESSYNEKTAIVARYLKKGVSGESFTGDTYMLLKLLLPGIIKRVYNINNRQLVKLYSQALGQNHSEMLQHLDQGDVAETIKMYFEKSTVLLPQQKSDLTIHDVDGLLDEMTTVTKEDDQQKVLTKIAKRCTANDLKMVIRLIKHDLRINAGAKHVLDALGGNAYPAFQASRDLQDVVSRVEENRREANGKPGMVKKLTVKASLMTPVLPMLAEACRSIGQAMKKCPNGIYAEIKYDGERVQVHKQGDSFQYFSRSLKPVLPHKVKHFKEYIPQAFPYGEDIILDSEVLLIDTKTSKPLPFGTLGVHKKAAFTDAQVCLFVFDCIHYNGQNLMERPIKERRQILYDHMKEIPNRILFSEMKFIKEPKDLQDMMATVFKEGLEGLVLKDVNSPYEPGKRHWLKVKKDYLHEGAMADTADLVVLGAYYGTGNKGGMMSVFLCGVYDPDTHLWCTVTKVGNGHDDETLERIQKELNMVKISKNFSKVPSWLSMKKGVVPDFVVADPKKAPVWEITGAEFSQSDIHTADGISIRFPRVTKIRDDKSWQEATDLPRLKELFKKSKENVDIFEAMKSEGKDKGSSSVTPRKRPNTSLSASPGSSSPAMKKSKVDEDDDAVMDIDDLNNSSTSVKVKSSQVKNNKTPSKIKKEKSESTIASNLTKPLSTSNESKVKSPIKSETLVNIFDGMRIYLPKSAEAYKKLRRYIVAYGGEVVDESQLSIATHAVTNESKMSSSTNAVHISTDWLWKCIEGKSSTSM